MPGMYDDDDLVGYDDDDDLVGYDDDDLLGDDDDDLLGDDDDDLLGYDDDDDGIGDVLDLIAGDEDEIGARRRRAIRRAQRRRAPARARPRPQRALPQRAVPRRALPPAGRRQERPAEPRSRPRASGRGQPLGGANTQGPAAGQLLVSTTVQETVSIERLFVVGRDALGAVLDPGSYSIADIKCGTKSQFSALPPLPGVMFQANATGPNASFGFDLVRAGTDFTVVIADAPAGSTFTWGAFAVPV